MIPQHEVLAQAHVNRSQPLNITFVPYFEQLASEFDIQTEIYGVETIYANESIAKVGQPPLSFLMPDGYVSFYDIDAAALYSNFSISVNDLPYRNYHRLNNFTKIALVGPRGSILKDPLVRPDLGQYQLVQMIARAFTKWSLLETYGINITDSTKTIFPDLKNIVDLTWVWPMPYYGSQDIWALLEAFGVLLYPVALTLQLPIYICIHSRTFDRSTHRNFFI